MGRWTREKRETLYRRAAETWGARAQILMLSEEAAELSAEATRFVNRPARGMVELAAEIADVEIMLAQVRSMIPTLDPLIALETDRKLDRLEGWLNAEEGAAKGRARGYRRGHRPEGANLEGEG